MVTLGLDAKGYTAGSKQATKSLKDTSAEATKTAKEMEARGKQAAQFFSKLRNEALGLLAIFTAGVGIKSFVESTITSSASLGRMSENLNMSSKDLAEWQLANKHAGGSAAGMTAQLKESAQSVAAFKNGMMNDGTHQSFFYGMKQEDLKDGESYLLARSKIISEAYKKDPVDAQFKASKMGIDEDTFNFLKQGPEAIKRLRNEQSKLAEEQAKAAIPAEALRKKLDDLKNNFEAIGVKILTSLMPQFTRFANWIAEHQTDIEVWANKAVAAIERFVVWANNAAESVGGWKNVLMALIALKVLSAVGPLVSLASALLNIGTALAGIGSMGAAVALLAKLGLAAGTIYLLLHSKELGGGTDTMDAERDPQNIKKNKNLKNNNSENRKYVWDELKKDGYTDAQAAGILGSLMQESQVNPDAVNPTSRAVGIAQWLGPRKKEFAKQYGHEIESSNLKEQTEFMLWELKNTEKSAGDKLRGTTNQADAARIHMENYERPGKAEGNLANRQGYANAIATAHMVNVAQSPAQSSNGGNTSTSETNINGPITINTKATDGKEIAKDLGTGLKQMSFAAQANTGLQ